MSNPEPVIRIAQRGDVPRIVELLADDQLGMDRDDASLPLAPEYYAAFDAITTDPRTRLLVLEVQQRVVGTLQLTFLPGLSRRGAERAQIEAVRIADDMRGHGLGRVLMESAIEQARDHGCRLVQLTTDLRRDQAHRFYESLGFVHTHAGMKLQSSLREPSPTDSTDTNCAVPTCPEPHRARGITFPAGDRVRAGHRSTTAVLLPLPAEDTRRVVPVKDRRVRPGRRGDTDNDNQRRQCPRSSLARALSGTGRYTH